MKFILFEEEITYLPELQSVAERQKQLLMIDNEIKEILNDNFIEKYFDKNYNSRYEKIK